MDNNSLLIVSGMVVLVIIVGLFLSRRKRPRKKVGMDTLYKKSSFKTNKIEKTSSKSIKDKEKIVEYETEKKKETIPKPRQITPIEPNNNLNYTFYDRPINVINGIGPAYSKRLKTSGIERISELVKARARFKEIENNTGIYTKLLDKWSVRADFLRIQAIRLDQVEQLIDIGVKSTSNLAKKDPEELREKLLENYPYRDVPTIAILKRWIRISNTLEKIDSNGDK